MLKVVEEPSELNAAGRSLLDEIVRDWARPIVGSGFAGRRRGTLTLTPTRSTPAGTGW